MKGEPDHILITGAAGAIGGALAERFRDHHPQARLTLVDYREAALRERATQLHGHALVCDLTDIDELAQWWRTHISEHSPVDVLVNCAGIMDIMSFAGTGWGQGRKILDINFTAPLRLMDLAVTDMLEQGRGCVINVASMAGQVALPGCSYYGGAKAGLAMASEIARMDLQPRGVEVITVYPGPVYSGLEDHARHQVQAGFLQRHIPTGHPDRLAEHIHSAFQRNKARVIYPNLYAPARALAHLNLTQRTVGRLAPQPKQ